MSDDNLVADDLDTLVPEWLTMAETAERLGITVSRVKQLLREGELLAVRRGGRGEPWVPAAFLAGDTVLKGLPGTLTLLHDAGYNPEESVRWLFTEDEAFETTPIAALVQNRGREVRRQAQTLGF